MTVDLQIPVTVDGISRTAVVSSDNQYRYALSRRWETDIFTPCVTFIMLNPSTANHLVDDPTIRRCIGFAKREGAGALKVVNLYALRSPNPSVLWTHSNPVGVENDRYISLAIIEAAGSSMPIIAAWGAGTRPERRAEVMERVQRHGAKLHCLGKTKGGAPRHPLYLRNNQSLEPYP